MKTENMETGNIWYDFGYQQGYYNGYARGEKNGFIKGERSGEVNGIIKYLLDKEFNNEQILDVLQESYALSPQEGQQRIQKILKTKKDSAAR